MEARLAPCGVYCGACPSYGKTCNGCLSERQAKGRKSRFGCNIRTCCVEVKAKSYCIDCDKYPCNIVNKKLLTTHKDDPRFKYRYDVIDNSYEFLRLGMEGFIMEQDEKWKCPDCGGKVRFYSYKCDTCGKEVFI